MDGGYRRGMTVKPTAIQAAKSWYCLLESELQVTGQSHSRVHLDLETCGMAPARLWRTVPNDLVWQLNTQQGTYTS